MDLDDLPVIVSLILETFDPAGFRHLLADDGDERVLAHYLALYARTMEMADRLHAGRYRRDSPYRVVRVKPANGQSVEPSRAGPEEETEWRRDSRAGPRMRM